MCNCVGAYHDDKRETCNSLLRVPTPFPEREPCGEIAVKTAACACVPFKLLEGVGLIACGALLWPVPCTVCKVTTEHGGTEVAIEKVSLGARRPNIPCHYEDHLEAPQSSIMNTGYQFGCKVGQRPTGEQDLIYATSTLTGYQCMSSGIGKIANAVISVLCCPIQSTALACCNNQGT